MAKDDSIWGMAFFFGSLALTAIKAVIDTSRCKKEERVNVFMQSVGESVTIVSGAVEKSYNDMMERQKKLEK